jgi:hypothetical protein
VGGRADKASAVKGRGASEEARVREKRRIGINEALSPRGRSAGKKCPRGWDGGAKRGDKERQRDAER